VFGGQPDDITPFSRRMDTHDVMMDWDMARDDRLDNTDYRSTCRNG
jgi:hypothetical protein